MNQNKFLLRVIGIVILVAGSMLILSCSAKQESPQPSVPAVSPKTITTNQPIDFKAVWGGFCEASSFETTLCWWYIDGIDVCEQSSEVSLDSDQTIALLGYFTNIVNDYSTNRGIVINDDDDDDESDSEIPPPSAAPDGMINIKNSDGNSCKIFYYSKSLLEEDFSFGMVITDNGNRSGFTMQCSREFIENIYNELKKINEEKQ